MRHGRVNRSFVAALLASIAGLAGCNSTTATASQAPGTKSTSTTTTTRGVLPPATLNGLRISATFAPADVVAPPATWLRIERPDGQTQLAAVFRPASPGRHPVVVYLHGSTGLAEPELAWAQVLADRGFIVVAGCYLDVDPAAAKPTSHYWIPCPGLPRGEPSHPAAVQPGYAALLDAASALPDTEPGALGVVGVSYGAIEALSTHEPRVKVIVADSGYGKAGVGPVTAPVLLLGMQSDPFVLHSNVEAFEWMLSAAGKTVESQYYGGPGHVATLNGFSPMLVTDATNRAVAWLRRTLG